MLYCSCSLERHISVCEKPSIVSDKIILTSPSTMNISSNNADTNENQLSQEEIFLENFYTSVSLRQKNLNQLYDTRKTRKRFSDSILSDPQHRRCSLHFQKTSTIPPIELLESQKLFVIRHGERVDSTFGVNWLDQVFDRTTGVYHRINLNLPKQMVTRKDLNDFLFDPPLTELGLHQCKIIGEELHAQGITIDQIYSSPALRCIQTADKILEGLQMRDKMSIRIEPCLFEFLKWYSVIPVKWPFLDLDELTQNGYKIDQSYQPFYPIESLRKDEDELMFYGRSHLITKSILKNHQKNVLIVGHASTIEVCTRQLIGGQPRLNNLKFLVLRVPFLSMHCLAKQIDGTWKSTKPPISPNKHAAVEPFDWRFFR